VRLISVFQGRSMLMNAGSPLFSRLCAYSLACCLSVVSQLISLPDNGFATLPNARRARRGLGRTSAWLLLAVSVMGGSTGRVRAQTVPRQVLSTQSAPLSEMLHLQASEANARPLAMVKGDGDEDGTPDLVIGYSAANGGTVQLLHGNPEALAPHTEANWLAAAPHETTEGLLPSSKFVSLEYHLLKGYATGKEG
jgi:hypothetical protein